METECSFETLMTTHKSTRRQNPEEENPYPEPVISPLFPATWFHKMKVYSFNIQC
jgi:hypothetical protein